MATLNFNLGEVTAAALHTLGQGASNRYPAARLLVHANNAVLRLAELKPELFTFDEWLATVAGQVEQSVANTRELRDVTAVRLNADESALRPLDVSSLSAWDPDWRSADEDTPRQAKIISRDRYLLYPPPTAGILALVRHVKVQGGYSDSDTIPLPRSMLPPMADYVAGMAEMADEEHVNSQRAAQLLAAFTVAVGKAQAQANG